MMTYKEYQQNKDKLKFFLDAITDENGTISQENAEIADGMLKELENVAKSYFEDDTPVRKPILEQPLSPFEVPTNNKSYIGGVSGKEYKAEFLKAVRSNFQVQNNLQIAEPTQGGFLVPSEMHNEIIVKLREQNILRQIGSVIQTASSHKIALQITAPVAQWTAEGQPIELTNMTFDQKTLDAYKLTVGISISNEIKQDSFYNLEEHIVKEFSAAMAALEEETFFTGDGQGKPLGLLNQLDTETAVTTASVAMAADDLINLIHKLPRPYRKNACFVMNDETLATIRKFKDSTTNYIWQPSMSLDVPSSLFGYPVYTSPNIPSIESGKTAVLFGDFSKFIIGQRAEMTFKPLYELHALQDLSTYLMIERVDGILTDSTAIVALKIK